MKEAGGRRRMDKRDQGGSLEAPAAIGGLRDHLGGREWQ